MRMQKNPGGGVVMKLFETADRYIFVLTYVPLMKKFFDVCREEKEIEGEEWL